MGWFRGLILATALSCSMLLVASFASARPIERVEGQQDYSLVLEDQCGVPGLTVTDIGTVDFLLTGNTRGAKQLPYYMVRIRETGKVTNVENGRSVTYVNTTIDKDLRVTDNGDGTSTILVMSTGNFVLYDESGKVIARNPGQERFEVLIDNNGTPSDPTDDEFLGYLGQVKGSTGRNDDFCAAGLKVLG